MSPAFSRAFARRLTRESEEAALARATWAGISDHLRARKSTLDLERAFNNRRFGGAGMRRPNFRSSSGGSATPPPPGFDRADLGMVAGWIPDPNKMLASAGRVSYWQATYAYTLAGAPTAYDLQQFTGGNQPLYSATGILGLPALYFDGARFMGTADAILANLLDGLQPLTVYAVMSRDSTGSNCTPWAFGDSGSSANAIICRTQIGIDNLFRGDAGGTTNTNGTVTVQASPTRMTSVFTGSAVTSWVGSSASVVTTANTRSPICDRFYVGAFRFSGVMSQQVIGWVGHILAYQIAHSAAQQAFVWGLLQAAYPGLA